MRLKLLTFIVTIIFVCAILIVIDNSNLNAERSSSRSLRGDLDNSINNYGPNVTVDIGDGYEITVMNNIILTINITVEDEDDPLNSTVWMGESISSVTVNLQAFGFGSKVNMQYIGPSGKPFCNSTRFEGIYSYNLNLNGVHPNDYQIQFNATDNGNPTPGNNLSTIVPFLIKVGQYNRAPLVNVSFNVPVMAEDQYNEVPYEIAFSDIFSDKDVDDGPFNNTDQDYLTYNVWYNGGWVDYTYGVMDFKNFTIEYNGTEGLFVKTKPNSYEIGWQVNLSAWDNLGESVEKLITIIINAENDPPILENAGNWIYHNSNASSFDGHNINCDQGAFVDITINASDIDNTALTYTLEDFNSTTTALMDAPFIIDPATGNFNFTPDNNAVGIFEFQISVSDGSDDVVMGNFSFEIANMNDPPVIRNIEVNGISQTITDKRVELSAKQGEEFIAVVTASDADVERKFDDSLEFTADSNTTIMLMITKTSNQTANYTFTPTNDEVGHHEINLTVTSGDMTDWVVASLAVINTNDPPLIESVDGSPVYEDKMVDMSGTPLTKESQNMSFTVEAMDIDFDTPEGEVLTWNQANTSIESSAVIIEGNVLERSASVNINGEKLDDGIYELNITVSDDGNPPLMDWVIVKIKVDIKEIKPQINNTPPELTQGKIIPSSGDTNTEFTFSVHYEDADGDEPGYIKVVIDGAEFDMELKSGESPSNGIYEYKTKLSEGNHSYYFKVSDGTIELDSGGEIKTSNITKASPVDGKKDDDKAGEVDWTLYGVLIIVVIVILIILSLIVLRSRKREEEPSEGFEEDRELKSEDEFRAQPFEEEEDEMGGWKIEDEELAREGKEPGEVPGAEELFEDTEVGKLAKGKLPAKYKAPEEIVEIEEEELPEEVELPEAPEPPVAPEEAMMPTLIKLDDKSVTCGICLGAIKTGLNAVKCRCGKLYHDTCAVRVAECPKCDAKFDRDYLKDLIEKGTAPVEKEEDFSDMEEFQQDFGKGKVKPQKSEATPLEILKQRLAKGEIDLDTFNALKKELE